MQNQLTIIFSHRSNGYHVADKTSKANQNLITRNPQNKQEDNFNVSMPYFRLVTFFLKGNREKIQDDMEKSRNDRLQAIEDVKAGQHKSLTYQNQYLEVKNPVPRSRSASKKRHKSVSPAPRSSVSARSGVRICQILEASKGY